MSISYEYYNAVLYAIDRLSEGKTKTRACDEAHITVSVFDEYVNRDTQLAELANDAIQRGYDAMAEALLEPDNHRIYGHTDAKMATVQQKAIMFFLSKKRPKEYGDRVQVDVNITADRAIIEQLALGKARALKALDAPAIDVEYVDVTPTDDDAAIEAAIFADFPA